MTKATLNAQLRALLAELQVSQSQLAVAWGQKCNDKPYHFASALRLILTERLSITPDDFALVKGLVVTISQRKRHGR